MSVQTGLLAFDGRQISREEVDFLLFDLEERGPDTCCIYVDGPVGLGFRGLFITEEDYCGTQPASSGSGAVITFDGRLDRRNELERRVGLPEFIRISDAELVLAAYEKYGESCFESIIGEYALVLWDKRNGHLFFARSLCGTRPLFYIVDRSSIVWSSELDHLILKTDTEAIVNDEYAIGFVYYQPDIDLSPFRHVDVVIPGTYMKIKASGEVSTGVPIWHPERITPLQLRSDSEYAEACREQIREAVSDRLRVKNKIWCELSGGLDSSTILSMADQILRGKGYGPDRLTSVSCIFEQSKDCDESVFIRIVEDARGRDGVHISEASQALTLGLENITFTGLPSTIHLSPGRHKTVNNLMEGDESRLLLSGVGGDELFCSGDTGSPEIADSISQGRVLKALGQVRDWSHCSGVPFWRVLMVEGVSPLTIGLPFLDWKPSDITELCSWATPKAQSWVNRRGYRVGLKVEGSIKPVSRRMLLFSVRSFRAHLSSGHFRAMTPITVSHPYAHQRLIEFVLSVPMNQLAQAGRDRWLMRRAMKGILPERIRTRRSKGIFDEALCRALIREQHLLTEAPLLTCEKGYVDTNRLGSAIDEMLLGKVRQIASFIHVISMERWLRSLSQIACRRFEIRNNFESYHRPSSEHRVMVSAR